MVVPAEIRRNATLVAIAGAVFGVLALVVVAIVGGLARPLTESELRIVGPSIDVEVWVLRVGAVAGAAIALWLAFRAWVRPAARVAWAAAAFFAVSWLPLHYGTAVRPALFAALGCVAAGGYATRWLVERDRQALGGGAAAVVVVAVLHPPSAVAVVVGLSLVAVVWARRQSPPLPAALVGGLVVGLVAGQAWTPGGFAQRLAPDNLLGLSPVGAALMMLALAAPVVVALLQHRWPHRRNATVVSVVLFVALLVPAVLRGDWSTAAVLPAYAVLTVAVGAGLLEAWQLVRRAGSVWASVALAATMVAFTAWQVVLAAGSLA